MVASLVAQLVILIKKNVTIALRNKRSTMIQIGVPLIFSLFLLVIEAGQQANEARSRNRANVKHAEYQTIGGLPRCDMSQWNPLDNCYTFGYSPSNDPTAMELARRISESEGIPADEVKAFTSQEETNAFLQENPTSVQGVYHFLVEYKDNIPDIDNIVGVRYALQLNQTIEIRFGKVFYPHQIVSWPMRQAVERELLEVVTGVEGTYDVDYLPFPHPELRPRDVVGTAGPTFYFGALIFNFVLQIGLVVGEKELHLRESMKLMGMKDSVYWLSHLIVNMVINLAAVLVLEISGYMLGFDFFVKNSFGTHFVLFMLFAWAMVPFAFFLSAFVAVRKTATTVGFAMFLFGFITSIVTGVVFSSTTDDYPAVPFFVSFLPFALLSQGMNHLGDQASRDSTGGLDWDERDTYTYQGNPDTKFRINYVYNWLILDFFVYMVLALWADNVFHYERHPFYFLFPSYWRPSKESPRRRAPPENKTELVEVKAVEEQKSDDVSWEMAKSMVKQDIIKAVEGGDADVLREERRVLEVDPQDCPIIIDSLEKTFYGTKLLCLREPSKDFSAVRGVNLTLNKNELFCLLGHNGAGKTTTINMLTGLLPPTEGDALVLGNSVSTQIEQIQPYMGVCPQHDILWDQLTGREHLEMFAGFKGISPANIPAEVNARLEDVGLVEAGDRDAGAYSGGMKRRLSVAISLIGDPKVVYLDEPTTGMDPVSRRQVWDLIEKVKKNRLTVLTTHSMEEADVLGDRIGIMKKGKLVVLGSSLHLKNKFGTGYNVRFVCSAVENVGPLVEYVSQNLEGAEVDSKVDTEVQFRLSRFAVKNLPIFFEGLEAKSELGVLDTQLSLVTLEEIFLMVGSMGEDEHDDRHATTEAASGEPPVGKLAPQPSGIIENPNSDVVILHPAPTAGAYGKLPDDKEETCGQKCCRLKWRIIGGFFLLFFFLQIVTLVTREEEPEKVLPPLKINAYDTTLADLQRLGVGDASSIEAQWAKVAGAPGSICSRGSEFAFYIRQGDPTKVLFHFEGGKPCYDSSTCDVSLFLGNFNHSVLTTDGSIRSGNFSGHFNESSSIRQANYTHIYIPMCTADLHVGASFYGYDAGLGIQHQGAVNTAGVLEWVYTNLPSASKVVISGWGPGAWGSLLFAQDIVDHYPPSTDTVYVADSVFDPWWHTPLSLLTDVAQVIQQGYSVWHGVAFQHYNISQGPVVSKLPATMQTLVDPNTWEVNYERLLDAFAKENPTVRVARIGTSFNLDQVNLVYSMLQSSIYVLTERQLTKDVSQLAYGNGTEYMQVLLDQCGVNLTSGNLADPDLTMCLQSTLALIIGQGIATVRAGSAEVSEIMCFVQQQSNEVLAANPNFYSWTKRGYEGGLGTTSSLFDEVQDGPTADQWLGQLLDFQATVTSFDESLGNCVADPAEGGRPRRSVPQAKSTSFRGPHPTTLDFHQNPHLISSYLRDLTKTSF